MLESEDGTVTGSIDVSRLDQIEPKTDEARAQVDALKAEVKAGQEQAARDAERMTEQARVQNPWAQPRADTRDVQGRETGESDQSGGDQSGTQQVPDNLADADTTTEAGPEAGPDQQDGQQDGQEDVEQLRAEAEGLGVQVDRRWGANRLRQEIDAARQQQG